MKLQRWLEQVNYEGTDYSDYYIGAQRYFRCNAFERATFQYIREHLHELPMYAGDVNGVRQNVIEVTFQDDCLVARYMVLVHKDFERGVKMAQMFLDRLERKGYVDPDTAEMLDEPDEQSLTAIEKPFNAPPPSGRYIAIKVDTGSSGGSFTTLSVQRKNHVREREAAARERSAKALAEVAGGPTPLVARRIDGISRRWKGVRVTGSDDRDADPIER